jgi:hypothetical protein
MAIIPLSRRSALTHTMNLKIDSDAFSAGQIESKIWAAEELEKLVAHTHILRISILGGWYGLLHFILKARGRQMIEWCRSYDLDTSACSVANIVNNTWEHKEWKFKSFPTDANIIEYNDGTNCVINTATEHFDNNTWYHRIPKGTLCLLQGNDLVVEDHINRPLNLEHFKTMYPLEVLFEGTKEFNFASGSFTRYMIIGYK